MAPGQWKSPFEPLSLAPDEKNELIRTAESLVDDVLEQYGEFLEPNARWPDAVHWNMVKEREGLRVYHSKRPGGGTPNRNMQLLLTTGSLTGQFNDVMYGLLNHSLDDMRVRTLYIGDTIVDAAVLDEVLCPTKEQPFRSTIVRWCVKGMPIHVRAVSKNRDTVSLDATGTRTLANGDKIGFVLLQSINFPKTPPLPQYERSSMSICTLYRQVAPDRVQVVARTYYLLEDCLLESATVKSIAEALISLWVIIQCAQRKKLTWLVQNRKSVEVTPGRDNGGQCCVVCGDELSKSRRSLKHACAVCMRPTCKKCRVKHSLMYITPTGQLEDHRTRFCLGCVTIANRLDSEEIAREEAMTGFKPIQDFDESASTITSHSS